MGWFTGLTSSQRGKATFRGDLGIKVIRAKRPGLFQRLVDWAKTVRTK